MRYILFTPVMLSEGRAKHLKIWEEQRRKNQSICFLLIYLQLTQSSSRTYFITLIDNCPWVGVCCRTSFVSSATLVLVTSALQKLTENDESNETLRSKVIENNVYLFTQVIHKPTTLTIMFSLLSGILNFLFLDLRYEFEFRFFFLGPGWFFPRIIL